MWNDDRRRCHASLGRFIRRGLIVDKLHGRSRHDFFLVWRRRWKSNRLLVGRSLLIGRGLVDRRLGVRLWTFFSRQELLDLLADDDAPFDGRKADDQANFLRLSSDLVPGRPNAIGLSQL